MSVPQDVIKELKEENKELRAKIEEAIMVIFDGSYHGAHHKQYVLDQVLRTLTDCPTIQKEATDCNGNQYTYSALDESEEYEDRVREFTHPVSGEIYEWDTGIPP